MDNDNIVQVADSDNGSLYGPNAVTGGAEDALKGHEDVEIKTSDTKNVSVKETDDDDDEGNKKEVKKEADKEDTKKSPKGDKKDPKEKTVEQRITDQKQAEEDVIKDLTAKGVDFDGMSKEYEDNGELSEDSYKALEKAGYPKSVVDAYIAGLEATVTAYRDAVFEAAGGEDEYDRIVAYVGGLSDAQINAFNHAIDAGDVTQLSVMFEGYKAQMGQKYGTANRTVLGGGNAGKAQEGYASKAEMVKAMRDPRYTRDKAYTEEVQRKTMHSNFIG